MKCDLCGIIIKNNGGYVKHMKSCLRVFEIKEEVFRLYVYENFSINEIKKKFSIGDNLICKIIGDKKRTLSEGIKSGRKKYPENFKHTDETKRKLREIRLDFMKKNPEKTAWRLKNLSYPEKLFLHEIEKLEWNKKYSIVREYSLFPYYVDFAFINELVAVEIDGSQHLLEDRKMKDNMKDKLLIENGWKVIRISENELKNNIKKVFCEIENFLSLSNNKKQHRIGIILNPKKQQKKERGTNGLTKLEYERSIKQRKTERPDYTILLKEIKSFGYVNTGKKYGVSDNAIRKWIKFYEKNM